MYNCIMRNIYWGCLRPYNVKYLLWFWMTEYSEIFTVILYVFVLGNSYFCFVWLYNRKHLLWFCVALYYELCTVVVDECIIWYTGCPRRNVPDFGRVFLMLMYTDVTQNTYIQIWTFTEILFRGVWIFDCRYSRIDYHIRIETGRNMWFL